MRRIRAIKGEYKVNEDVMFTVLVDMMVFDVKYY